MNGVSVVIATLGGDSLFRTINNINCGTIVPDEILLCIPAELAYKLNHYSFTNIKIVKTDKYGQVYQRIQGFKVSKYDFVLQLDDDIILENNCLKIMLDTLSNLDIKSAICPVYYSNNIDENNSLIKHPFYQKLVNPENYLRKLYNKLLHGKMKFNDGEITYASINIHFNPSERNERYYELKWLPGGCVLHRKSNLYLDNYFLYSGKAFCEDIMHSFLLKKNGIKLFVSRYSFCVLTLENETMGMSSIKKLNYLFNEFKARLLYAKFSNSSYLRLIFFYLSIYYHLPFTFIKNKIFNVFRKS